MLTVLIKEHFFYFQKSPLLGKYSSCKGRLTKENQQQSLMFSAFASLPGGEDCCCQQEHHTHGIPYCQTRLSTQGSKSFWSHQKILVNSTYPGKREQATYSDLKTMHRKFKLKAVSSFILFVLTCKSWALMNVHSSLIYTLKFALLCWVIN